MKYGKTSLFTGAILMALAASLGAIGAHALKNSLEPKYLETFLTGARYHTYHALGLLALGAFEVSVKRNFSLARNLMIVGIVLFSFNCYIYAVTQVKTFAMIVPLGGFSFIFSWLILAFQILKIDKE